MSFLNSTISVGLLCSLVLFLSPVTRVPAAGPNEFDGELSVSIYRDFDDGLFGRSLYRGVLFSVKLNSFKRYGSLPVSENPVFRSEGLTGYLVSAERAAQLAAGMGRGITRYPLAGKDKRSIETGESGPPEDYLYSYQSEGIQVSFSLEPASEQLYNEIRRTYPENEAVAQQVIESYRMGYVVRIHQAENVYRPEYSELDYEDILVSASLIGDRFQPLWGIHDGNDITAP